MGKKRKNTKENGKGIKKMDMEWWSTKMENMKGIGKIMSNVVMGHIGLWISEEIIKDSMWESGKIISIMDLVLL